jgi:hypothetical protein
LSAATIAEESFGPYDRTLALVIVEFVHLCAPEDLLRGRSFHIPIGGVGTIGRGEQG